MYFKYSDTELKKLAKSLVITYDTREQENSHILEYFDNKKIAYKKEKMNTGDYGIFLPQSEELSVVRDTYFECVVERKNSIDELASSIKEERFENELIRSQGLNFIVLVEDMYENLVNGNYRSQYNKDALIARIKSFEARYGFTTVFVPKLFSGHYIQRHLLYMARNELKG